MRFHQQFFVQFRANDVIRQMLFCEMMMMFDIRHTAFKCRV